MIAAPAAADPDPGDPAARAELERVFKNYRRPERVPVAFVVDGAEVATDGPLLLELGDGTGSPAASAAAILGALTPRLGAEASAELVASVRDHRLSLDALRAIGLAARYDPQRLELRIDVPPRLTRKESHDLGSSAPAAAAHALAPSDTSGYVNLRARGDTDQSFGLHGDSTVNLQGWVLEGRGDLARGAADDGAPLTWHRGDLIALRDDPRHAMRYVAGDISVAPAGLQSGYPLLGVAASRNFALQPYRVIRPIGAFDFVLERASKVTVLVNGTPVQTLSLAAGRHDIRDLPLGATHNEIELQIRDDTGRERRIAFSMASPDALLAPGVVQFSLGGGYPLVSDTGLRSYDFDRPALSGRLRLGTTSWLTLGGALDGDRDRQVAGGNATVATRLGNLSIDGARSRTRGERDGTAWGARYDFSAARAPISAFTITAHRYSPSFATVGPQMTSGHYRADLALAASGRLPLGWLARIDTRYDVGRDVSDAQTLSLGASRSFGSVGLSASMTLIHNSAARDDARLFFSAHWKLPEQRGSVLTVSRASAVAGISNELTYAKNAVMPGNLGTSLTLSETEASVGAASTIDYLGYRVAASVVAGATLDNAGHVTTHTASAEAATALAFAGGRVAWSRPITSSFVMIERNPALDGVWIGVNPVRGGYAAGTDTRGLAVVPNLEPYRVSEIALDAPELPAGYSLGPASYAVIPGYRSGTLIAVGESGTVVVTGILLHYNGEALRQVTGELLSIDDPDRPPIALMTNRAGRFSAAGLRPGRYAIRMSDDARPAGELEIPPGTTGVYAARIVEVP